MASKRKRRRKSCEGKIMHNSMLGAEVAAAKMRKKNRDWIIAYGCRFCGGYHVGHPPKHIRQSIRDRKAKQ